MTSEFDGPRHLDMFVDFLMPSLTPYETTVYLLLLRRQLGSEASALRIGKRTIAASIGRGVRASQGNYEQITKVLKSLELKACLIIGDTNREGTSYRVLLPEETPIVQSQLAVQSQEGEQKDYFQDPTLRLELFARDGWRCRYCGDRVSELNATLDHISAASLGGLNEASNLATACLVCNAIKGTRTYEDAAADLLTSIRLRRVREGLHVES